MLFIFMSFFSTWKNHNLISTCCMIACLLHQTSWTTNLDLFSKWLSSINFSGGGFGEAAIAEGLAEALLVGYCRFCHRRVCYYIWLSWWCNTSKKYQILPIVIRCNIDYAHRIF